MTFSSPLSLHFCASRMVAAMAWQLSVMRDNFEAFSPPLDSSYGFDEKWRFVMWSLERQERRLPLFRKMFFAKVAVEESAGVEEASE